MSEVFRTPEERFAALPDFPWEPRWADLDGLRVARVDEGDGKPVVFLHGEPTWSFLWRRVMPPVLAAGFRCVAPDFVGFGRSDKPVDLGWYTFDRHVACMRELLFEHLDLRAATLVVHDWGGPIGLRLAAEHPDRVDRIVVMDSGLFTGHQRMSERWHRFRDWVEETPDLPIGAFIQDATFTELPPEVVAAYDAPFPTAVAKAGARAFPLLVPLTPDAPGAAIGRRLIDQLREDQRPMLFLWADHDLALPLETGQRVAAALGAAAPEVIRDAGHFLQEDAGEKIGRRAAAWLGAGR